MPAINEVRGKAWRTYLGIIFIGKTGTKNPLCHFFPDILRATLGKRMHELIILMHGITLLA